MNIPNEKQCEALWDEVRLPQHIRRHCEAVMRRASALLDEFGEGWDFNEDLVVAGALLHDVLRLQSFHDQAGADFLMEKGYPEIARIVASHMYLTFDMREHIDERAVVFLADKMVMGDQECSIEARYMGAVLKGADPEEMQKQTLRVEALYAALKSGAAEKN